MWLFDYFKKKREAKNLPVRVGPTLQELKLQQPTRPAPPMPRMRPSRHSGIDITTINDNSPVIYGVDLAEPSRDRTVYWEPSTGNGGTFDGGGASGDWSDSRGCGAPDTSSSSDYSPSDSGSSCDSGSSSYE